MTQQIENNDDELRRECFASFLDMKEWKSIKEKVLATRDRLQKEGCAEADFVALFDISPMHMQEYRAWVSAWKSALQHVKKKMT